MSVSGVVVWNVRVSGCLYTKVVMTIVLLPQSRKEFALEAIYSSNYSQVLSGTAAYDYTLAEGNSKDKPCCYIDHPTASRLQRLPRGEDKKFLTRSFVRPAQRKPVHPFSFLFSPPTGTAVIPRLCTFNGEL